MDVPPQQDLRELGVWWLPANRDRQVAGILTHSPDGGSELEMIGALNSPFDRLTGDSEPRMITDADLQAAGDYGRICGLAGGKSFTLEGCFQVQSTNWLSSRPGSSVERIHVNRIIRGAEFDDGEVVDTTRVDARLLHLQYWIAKGGVAEQHYFPDKVPEGKSDVTLRASLVPDRLIELEDGMELSFCETISVVGDRVTERGLRRGFDVRIEGPRRPLAAYLPIVAAVQDLASIGLHRTVSIESFEFHHPDITHRLHDRERSIPIELFAQWINWETRDVALPSPGDRLFSLDELGGNEAIQRWMAFVRHHRGTIARCMGTRYRKGGYVSDRLLSRAAALEALDRDCHGRDRRTFVERIRRLVELAGSPFTTAVGDSDLWASRLKERRNAAAHHSNADPADLGHLDHWLAESAYYLFVLCLLRHAEASPAAFDRFTADSSFQQTMSRVQTVDEPAVNGI